MKRTVQMKNAGIPSASNMAEYFHDRWGGDLRAIRLEGGHRSMRDRLRRQRQLDVQHRTAVNLHRIQVRNPSVAYLKDDGFWAASVWIWFKKRLMQLFKKGY